MRRVLFLSMATGDPIPGSDRLWFSAAISLLNEKMAEVAACVPATTPWPKHYTQLREAGAQLIFHRPLRKIWARSARFAASVVGASPARAWQKAVKRFDPELVVVSQGWWNECVVHREFLDALGCPKIFVTHGASEYYWHSESLAEKARELFRAAPAIYFVSDSNRSLVELQLAQRLDNAEIVRNPIRGEYVDYPPVDHGQYRLACVARYRVSVKGQDLLFRILAKDVWRKRPLSIRLYGAGEDESRFQRWIEMFDLKSVEIMGYEEDPGRLYEHCHGMVLPSRHEGLPLVALEAMKCGRMVIATSVGTQEVIRDGETGFVADGPNVLSVEHALERAWSRRDDWRSMGLRASEHYSDLYADCRAGHDWAKELMTFIE